LMPDRKRNVRTTAFARFLRRRQTPAEVLLWRLLRARRIGGFKFRRQVPAGTYVLDFYCPEARLAVELDGGGHNEPFEVAKDRRRTVDLSRMGIRVVRYWNNEVLDRPDEVLQDVIRALRALVPPSE
jgi:very-short-patch-repair endonuclease